MTETQIKAVVKACSAALATESASTMAPEPQRTLSLIAVCQFCLEGATTPQADGSGGWGTSSLAQPPLNNPFGIQFSQRLKEYGEFNEESWEIENGQKVKKAEAFQKFPDLASAFVEHQRLLLMKPQIRAALPHGWRAVCVALGPPPGAKPGFYQDAEHCGYSTNPAYPETLEEIGNECNLDKPGQFEWWAAGASLATKPAFCVSVV